ATTAAAYPVASAPRPADPALRKGKRSTCRSLELADKLNRTREIVGEAGLVFRSRLAGAALQSRHDCGIDLAGRGIGFRVSDHGVEVVGNRRLCAALGIGHELQANESRIQFIGHDRELGCSLPGWSERRGLEPIPPLPPATVPAAQRPAPPPAPHLSRATATRAAGGCCTPAGGAGQGGTNEADAARCHHQAGGLILLIRIPSCLQGGKCRKRSKRICRRGDRREVPYPRALESGAAQIRRACLHE